MAFETGRSYASGELVRGALVRGSHRVEVEGQVCWCEPQSDPARPGGAPIYRVGLEFPAELPRHVRQGLTVLLAGTGFWRPE